VIDDGSLRALRADDGSVAWEVAFAAAPAAAPVGDIGWLVATTDAGEVLRSRAADGRLIWRRDLKSPAHGRPALAADRVYVPTSHKRILPRRVRTGHSALSRRL